MIDKEKAENFMGKAVDFLNDKGEKAKEFAKEHEIEEKVTGAAEKVGDGVYNAVEKMQNKFEN